MGGRQFQYKIDDTDAGRGRCMIAGKKYSQKAGERLGETTVCQKGSETGKDVGRLAGRGGKRYRARGMSSM